MYRDNPAFTSEAQLKQAQANQANFGVTGDYANPMFGIARASDIANQQLANNIPQRLNLVEQRAFDALCSLSPHQAA